MVEIKSLLFWVDCYGGCEWIVKVSLWWWWWILGVDFWVCLDL